ncbi:hypothetical protein SAMN06265370_11555 [Puniceibacterium sediminis]|uniref:Uncharacterized protein n=1 Tax=Puniceibacterium sediminis TaxID=1608407 RepID=A0A238Y836_9RHOB|nr:hypothetical protein SAMN06265370_11555 [Puniceibacterium sediminis]
MLLLKFRRRSCSLFVPYSASRNNPRSCLRSTPRWKRRSDCRSKDRGNQQDSGQCSHIRPAQKLRKDERNNHIRRGVQGQQNDPVPECRRAGNATSFEGASTKYFPSQPNRALLATKNTLPGPGLYASGKRNKKSALVVWIMARHLLISQDWTAKLAGARPETCGFHLRWWKVRKAQTWTLPGDSSPEEGAPLTSRGWRR